MNARAIIVVTALLWSTGGTAIKLSALDAPAIAAGRALVAAIALYALMPAARHRPTIGTLKIAIAYATTCALFVTANRLTTAGHAIFIQNTAPVWVLLLAPRLLGERASRAELASIPVALLGCALVFVEHLGGERAASTETLLGDLCAFLASLSYAALIILYRRSSHEESMSATVLGNVILVVTLAPFAIMSGVTPSAVDLGVLLYLGLVQQALAAALFVRAIRSVSALEASLLTLLEPIFSPIWAYYLVGETMGPLAIAGAALIVAATVGRTIASSRAQ